LVEKYIFYSKTPRVMNVTRKSVQYISKYSMITRPYNVRKKFYIQTFYVQFNVYYEAHF